MYRYFAAFSTLQTPLALPGFQNKLESLGAGIEPAIRFQNQESLFLPVLRPYQGRESHPYPYQIIGKRCYLVGARINKAVSITDVFGNQLL